MRTGLRHMITGIFWVKLSLLLQVAVVVLSELCKWNRLLTPVISTGREGSLSPSEEPGKRAC